MRLLLLLVTALLFTGASPAPTHSALRRVWERNAHTVVEVWSKRGEGAGVIVGADGHIATSTHNIDLYEAKVRINGREVTAKVLSANARSRIALLQVSLEPGETLRASTVHGEAPLAKQSRLVGIAPKKGGGTEPSTGRVLELPRGNRPHLLTDLPLPPGSPLFDHKGRLVAMAVERVGKTGSLAVPLGPVRAQALAGEMP